MHLTGRAESIYEVLPAEAKGTYERATKALGGRLKPAERKALASARLLRRKQRPGETVDEFVQAFEGLFEKSYDRQSGVDLVFKGCDLFVRGLVLK